MKYKIFSSKNSYSIKDKWNQYGKWNYKGMIKSVW